MGLSLASLVAVLGALTALTPPFGPGGVDACSCLPPVHPQQYACRADFVIVARVKTVQHLPKQQVNTYKVLVKKEFQTSEKAKVALQAGRLFTASSSSMCGKRLALGETYLVVGHVRGGKPTISLCGYIVPWKDVSVRQRKGFRLLYKQGCDCKIADCSRRWPCPATDGDTCQLTTSCQSRNSVCTRHSGGKCGWTQNKSFKECLKGETTPSTRHALGGLGR